MDSCLTPITYVLYKCLQLFILAFSFSSCGLNSRLKKSSKKAHLMMTLPYIWWRPYLTQKAAKCVYNYLIQPISNYTDTVCGGLLIGCGKNLQRLQNRAARIVQERSTTDEAFQKLGWINLQTQRITHKCILVYKCLYNLAPPYLCDYFVRHNCIHSHNTTEIVTTFTYPPLN